MGFILGGMLVGLLVYLAYSIWRSLFGKTEYICRIDGYNWGTVRPEKGTRCPGSDKLGVKEHFVGEVLWDYKPLVLFLIIFGIIGWICLMIYTRILDNIAFLGSLLLSIASLSVVSILLLGVLTVLGYITLRIVSVLPGDNKAKNTVLSHTKLFGTIANLLAGLGALMIVSWIYQRPPDYWDFGIQFLIALIIEVVIFKKL